MPTTLYKKSEFPKKGYYYLYYSSLANPNHYPNTRLFIVNQKFLRIFYQQIQHSLYEKVNRNPSP